MVAEDEDAFEKSDTILQSGSRFWMAPELFRAELPGSMLSKASDVWSFAMLVMEVNCPNLISTTSSEMYSLYQGIDKLSTMGEKAKYICDNGGGRSRGATRKTFDSGMQ